MIPFLPLHFIKFVKVFISDLKITFITIDVKIYKSDFYPSPDCSNCLSSFLIFQGWGGGGGGGLRRRNPEILETASAESRKKLLKKFIKVSGLHKKNAPKSIDASSYYFYKIYFLSLDLCKTSSTIPYPFASSEVIQ